VSRVGFSFGLETNSWWFVLLMEATTHLLIKESLHAIDNSKPHSSSLRLCSIPYSLAINIYSQKYQYRKGKEKQSGF